MTTISIPTYFHPGHQIHSPATVLSGGELMNHPDSPSRVTKILERLVACPKIEVNSTLSIEELAAIHSHEYLEVFKETSQRAGDNFIKVDTFPIRSGMGSMRSSSVAKLGYYSTDTEAPVGARTFEAACGSAAVSSRAAADIVSGKHASAYALCRPSGHHAGRDFMGGFCYLNNSAVAASRLKAIGRVAIIDIDYHYGNGTHNIVGTDQDIFFSSIHGDLDFEYPYYEEPVSDSSRIMNVGLPAGTDGVKYFNAFCEVCKRVQEFSPSALVISSGVDAGENDPFGTFRLKEKDFLKIGRTIRELKKPTVFVQEGGYNLKTLPSLVHSLLLGFTAG